MNADSPREIQGLASPSATTIPDRCLHHLICFDLICLLGKGVWQRSTGTIVSGNFLLIQLFDKLAMFDLEDMSQV